MKPLLVRLAQVAAIAVITLSFTGFDPAKVPQSYFGAALVIAVLLTALASKLLALLAARVAAKTGR